jgi:hypothetical protein
LEFGIAQELNIRKTCFFHQLDLIPDRDRAAYSLRPGVGTFGQGTGQLFTQSSFNFEVRQNLIPIE